MLVYVGEKIKVEPPARGASTFETLRVTTPPPPLPSWAKRRGIRQLTVKSLSNSEPHDFKEFDIKLTARCYPCRNTTMSTKSPLQS